MNSIRYAKKIPVKYNVDIFVAGGGPAGAAAAIMASRQGSKVYLAEAHTCCGGMGTAGLVPLFMTFTDGVNFLAGGIGKEILERLRKAGGTLTEGRAIIRAEVLKRLYEEMLMESGVQFTYYTKLVDVVVKNGMVSEAICDGKSGLFAVKAKVFIDGTGDGDLAVSAGAKYEKGDDKGLMMAGTLCSLWSGIDWDKVAKSGLAQASMLEKAFKDGVFTVKDRHLPGMMQLGETLGGANIGHTFGVDGTNEQSLTKAYLQGRKYVPEYERYYKKYFKGYEKMELAATGSLLGIRETRRIIGDYILNVDDFKKCAVFEDEIGRYSYRIDIHASNPDKKSFAKFKKEFSFLYLNKGESYGIPYRILVPSKLKNVLVAGRCVSTDRYMQSSIRVMPGCYITGQAAGMAAAIMAEDKKDSRSIDVRKLQKKLKKAGAYLPNLK
ncbi:MAG: FAD-dependent oxidoreductase [Candidatus Omnitrophica bacterium]|nr:FAD-dependent oxidoreductase [Candidatus Omnitrophota bacterium]